MRRLLPLFLMLMFLPLAACSNLTPNQIWKIDTGIYIAGNGVASVAVKAGKLPEATARADLGALRRNLDALREWIAANPNLADVVGVTPAELTATSAAADIISGYIFRFGMLEPLPPLTPPVPATPPAAEQPAVPLPVPGS